MSNIAIGSFQEIRSKRALDRLAALVAPQAVIVRDGADRRLPVDEVVVGDLVRLAAGDQVVADGRVVDADGLALDEANLTGESEPVVRGVGEPVWSGSFVTEGAALFEATAVGPREPRGPCDRDGACVSPPALAARAGQRPALAVAGCTRGSRSRSG